MKQMAKKQKQKKFFVIIIPKKESFNISLSMNIPVFVIWKPLKKKHFFFYYLLESSRQRIPF